MKNSTTIITTTLIVLLMASFHSYQPINGTSITPDTEFYYDGGLNITVLFPPGDLYYSDCCSFSHKFLSNNSHIIFVPIYYNVPGIFTMDQTSHEITQLSDGYLEDQENLLDITLHENIFISISTFNIYYHHINGTMINNTAHNLNLIKTPLLDSYGDRFYIFDQYDYTLYILNSTNLELIDSFIIPIDSSSSVMQIIDDNIYFRHGTDFSMFSLITKSKTNDLNYLGLSQGHSAEYPLLKTSVYTFEITNKNLWTYGFNNDIPVIIKFDFNGPPYTTIYPTEDTFTALNDDINGLSGNLIADNEGRSIFLKFSLYNITNINQTYLSIYSEENRISNLSIFGVYDDTWTEIKLTGNNKPTNYTPMLDSKISYGYGWISFNVSEFVIVQDDGYASFLITSDNYFRSRSKEGSSYRLPVISVGGQIKANKYPINPIISTPTNTVTQTETNTVTQTDTYAVTTTEISLSEVIVTNFKSEVNSPSLFLIIISLTSLFILKTQNRLHRR